MKTLAVVAGVAALGAVSLYLGLVVYFMRTERRW